ncbi:MAG: copper amine oxidase N-terminal domain-containing protein, partial [Oscillospiraceae bacterium]|nr:copper amine oxidase N-terminal domain-containing protein [Oscillospiraceae bacterium]
GTTFLPVRAVAEALGQEVDWDGATNTVYLTGAASAAQTLVGEWSWNWTGPYYAFEANGQGTAAGAPMRWSTNDGVLSICVTPDFCGDDCTEPAEWYYEIEGNQLTLTSTIAPSWAFTYTLSGTATAGQTLVGEWNWIGPYYVFEADGRGTVGGAPIRWSTSNGVLSICTTPDFCGNNCTAPAEWFYIIEGDELTLISTWISVYIDEMSFTYTRG